MLQIPQYVLENLRCSICGSYLSSKPLMIRAENKQVCGKCYKLLPAYEKEKCVRQIGLESVAEVLVFPCRYNTQGCPYKFKWCEDKEHEATCPYRSLMSLSTDSSRYCNIDDIYNDSQSSYGSELHCETPQVKATFSYKIKDKTSEMKNLSYTLDIKGNCDNTLVIKNTNTEEAEEVELKMDGTVFLGSKPELLFSDITATPVSSHNIYETLRTYDTREAVCLQCGKIPNHTDYPIIGQNECLKYKSNLCVHCVKQLEKEAKTLCKNHKKGCRETLDFDSAHNHETNCQFNDYKCILEPCNVNSTLFNLKEHIKNEHSSEIFLTNEFNKRLTSKDDVFVVFCYGNIFKCVYFYYKSFVELTVTYIGSSDEAVKFFYEVIVNIKGYVISKRSKCTNLNTAMLDKGITFEKSELVGAADKRLNVEATIRIINKK
ncbi:unnamed protein product [Diabrotica balteata]|uniref:SIAH-type domain-containing protein n=1 Tax=Diabrotica balteata TaxID=107213 RepID=A0A9N9SMD9_DIABA|nr:unnamed protein product [Diabrotica balteata]